MRETLSYTTVMLDIIANTDAEPPIEVVETILKYANKWREEVTSVRTDGTLFVGEGFKDAFVVVDQNGMRPPPWPPEMAEALRRSFDKYSLDWLGVRS